MDMPRPFDGSSVNREFKIGNWNENFGNLWTRLELLRNELGFVINGVKKRRFVGFLEVPRALEKVR